MTLLGSNHTSSGRYNRRLVFDLIHSGGGVSRRALVEATGLKSQTMSNICKELLDRGLVLETTRQDGARGAPHKELRIDPDAGCSLGLHVDRDGLVGIVCDLLGREKGRVLAKASLDDPQDTVRTILEMVQELQGRLPGSPAWGLGIAMPTLQEAEFEHSIGPPGWDAWARVPIAEVVEDACGLPVIVENDATAAAIAEGRAGMAVGLSHYVLVFVGHGLGAGIVNDSTPLQGVWNNAGEIGLTTWPAEFASPDGIEETPFSIDELGAMLGIQSHELGAPGRLEALYSRRDSVLMRWLDLNARRLRLLVSLLENILDPQTILVGGNLPEVLVHSLIDRAYPLLPSVSARSHREMPRLRAAALGSEAAALGGAMLPIMAHGSPDFRRISFMRGRSRPVEFERRFDRVTGQSSDDEAAS